MNSVTTPTPFEERMFAVIRDKMGDLMTDEELRVITEASIQKAFFEPQRVEEKGEYGRTNVRQIPPYLTLMLRELLNEKVQETAAELVTKHLNEHPEIYSEAVDAAIAKGFMNIVMDQVNSFLRMPLHQLSQSVTDMANAARNRGY